MQNACSVRASGPRPGGSAQPSLAAALSSVLWVTRGQERQREHRLAPSTREEPGSREASVGPHSSHQKIRPPEPQGHRSVLRGSPSSLQGDAPPLTAEASVGRTGSCLSPSCSITNLSSPSQKFLSVPFASVSGFPAACMAPAPRAEVAPPAHDGQVAMPTGFPPGAPRTGCRALMLAFLFTETKTRSLAFKLSGPQTIFSVYCYCTTLETSG